MENGKQPAFAVSREMCEMPNEIEIYPYKLTRREYFAGLAMQGLLANPHAIVGQAVNAAVNIADQLLLELEKPTSK